MGPAGVVTLGEFIVTAAERRVISLIPSATEIVAALGLTHTLVGRSHECDYPPEVTALPVCTQPKIDSDGSSRQIHDRITELLQSALSVYRLDLKKLEELQPTHILTQAQCDVCAVSLAEVEAAVAELTHRHPQVLSLEPNTLSEVWADIQRVAAALGADAAPVLQDLQARVAHCQQRTQTLANRPRVACIEWSDPLMAAGNWVPELVELAGGHNCFGTAGEHSPWLEWQALQAADPDILVFMPCGFDLERTRQDALPLLQRSEWQNLKAVRTGNVYITDGNQYFNRPGPRLVDSLEILAEILHPDLFQFGYRGTGWEQVHVEALQGSAG